MAQRRILVTKNCFTRSMTILLIIPIVLCRIVEDEELLISEASDELGHLSEGRTWEDTDDVIDSNYDKRIEKPQYDPALRYMGLGKRQKEKPKYNPGWKFIGLGRKRIEEARERMSHHHPYFSILALSNLNDFFHHLKEEVQFVKTGEPESKKIIPGGPKESYLIRSSKKSSKISERPMYDPSWALTGLGRK